MAESKKLNTEMINQENGQEEVDNTSKDDDDVMIKTEQSLDEELHVELPEAPVPCPCFDGSYDERLPAPESSVSAEANLHLEKRKADEKVHKYLEIVHHVKTKQNESPDADLFRNKEHEKQMPCKASDGFSAKHPCGPGSSSVLGVTQNIEMTYLHKKDDEKVDKYRYMTLDQDRKRREDLGRYEVPCTSSTCVNEQPPAQESHSALGATSAAESLLNTDDAYDEVMTENGNSSETSGGGYEEPDVVNLERPPVPGRSPQPATPGEISDYQEELQ